MIWTDSSANMKTHHLILISVLVGSNPVHNSVWEIHTDSLKTTLTFVINKSDYWPFSATQYLSWCYDKIILSGILQNT